MVVGQVDLQKRCQLSVRIHDFHPIGMALGFGHGDNAVSVPSFVQSDCFINMCSCPQGTSWLQKTSASGIAFSCCSNQESASIMTSTLRASSVANFPRT